MEGEEAVLSKDKDGPINFDIEPGIYQAGLLVDTFQKILMRMNNTTADLSKSSSFDGRFNFPYNELHESSRFRHLYDWEHLLVKEKDDD